MKAMENTKFARRDFFRKAVRWTILTSMVGGTVYLTLEDRIQPAGCAQSEFCGNCQKVKDCALDQAKNFRQNGK